MFPEISCACRPGISCTLALHAQSEAGLHCNSGTTHKKKDNRIPSMRRFASPGAMMTTKRDLRLAMAACVSRCQGCACVHDVSHISESPCRECMGFGTWAYPARCGDKHKQTTTTAAHCKATTYVAQAHLANICAQAEPASCLSRVSWIFWRSPAAGTLLFACKLSFS